MTATPRHDAEILDYEITYQWITFPFISTLYSIWVYVVFILVEKPVKRIARKIAHSGHWVY